MGAGRLARRECRQEDRWGDGSPASQVQCIRIPQLWHALGWWGGPQCSARLHLSPVYCLCTAPPPPLQVRDPELKALVGAASYYSITYRLFKLPGILETSSEDYRQTARYKVREGRAEQSRAGLGCLPGRHASRWQRQGRGGGRGRASASSNT